MRERAGKERAVELGREGARGDRASHGEVGMQEVPDPTRPHEGRRGRPRSEPRTPPAEPAPLPACEGEAPEEAPVFRAEPRRSRSRTSAASEMPGGARRGRPGAVRPCPAVRRPPGSARPGRGGEMDAGGDRAEALGVEDRLDPLALDPLAAVDPQATTVQRPSQRFSGGRRILSVPLSISAQRAEWRGSLERPTRRATSSPSRSIRQIVSGSCRRRCRLRRVPRRATCPSARRRAGGRRSPGSSRRSRLARARASSRRTAEGRASSRRIERTSAWTRFT